MGTPEHSAESSSSRIACNPVPSLLPSTVRAIQIAHKAITSMLKNTNSVVDANPATWAGFMT